MENTETDAKLSDAIEGVREYNYVNHAQLQVEKIATGDLACAYDWTATYLVEIERRLSSANAPALPSKINENKS